MIRSYEELQAWKERTGAEVQKASGYKSLSIWCPGKVKEPLLAFTALLLPSTL